MFKAIIKAIFQISFSYELEPSDFEGGSSYASVLIHEHGQMVAPNNPKFGAKVLLLSDTEVAKGTVSHYDITASEIKTLNHEPDWPCDPDGRAKAGECFQNYLDAKMECRLPWRQESAAGNIYIYIYAVWYYLIKRTLVPF